MAKPKKEKELRHPHRVYVRFTDTEYELLQQYAENTNRTIAELVRKLALNQKVTIKYELVADIKEARQLQMELGRIGGNLNQTARHFNTGGIHSQEMRRQIEIAFGNLFTFMMFLVAFQYIISEKIEKLDIFHMIRYRIPFIKWHKSIFFILIKIQQFRLILALQKNDTAADLMLGSLQYLKCQIH